MLNVHYSNRLEVLADQLAELIRSPCGSPFVAEMIIVQSTGMARWLSLRLARRLGICAQIRFPFPAAFIWDLLRRVQRNVPETSPFAPQVLAWRIMALLKDLEAAPCFAPLQTYCAAGDANQRFALASRIAEVFAQYLVYRPDWIVRWEQGDETHWQAELWRRLAMPNALHRVQLHAQWLQALQTEQVTVAGLPARVSLIGIPTLPPLHLEVFAHLAAHSEVHGFFLKPCLHDWQERPDASGQHALPAATAAVQSAGEDNRLLTTMGKLGREFIALVQAQRPQVHNQFVAAGEDTLLHCLQWDILHQRQRGTPAYPATPLQADDRSLQVHVCHSRMREVEVLYDQLLRLFDTSKDLKPSDILVMTPDIEAYAPLIEAVFAGGQSAAALPFSIADRHPRAESPLASGFFALLDLPGSRYDANQLFTLLEIAALQRRFALQASDLTLVQRWLRETSVRWGIDQEGRAALGLPPRREHTWRAGLDRLLMGYALPGDRAQFFAEILPYEAVTGSEAQVLGRLHTFAEAAFTLASTLRAPRPIAAWVTTLTAVLEQFFQPDANEEPEAQALREALQYMGQSAAQAGFGEAIGLEVIQSYLRRTLASAEWSTRFLTGGVTFCALVPMRSIPFKVVCLLGMTYDQFPRLQRPLSFDRMAQAPRPGDRSRRDDDRYLFLESLLSARQCLYVSYVGRNIHDNSVLPPSVLVHELLDTITQGFYLAGQAAGKVYDQVVTEHPLQAFSRRYFSGNDPRLFTYTADLTTPCGTATQGPKPLPPLVTAGLEEADQTWRTVALWQLLAFFRHPTRYFMQHRLGIFLETQTALLQNREPLTLDGLARYRLRQDVLRRHLAQEPPAHIQRAVRATGLLPHGQVGQAIFEREWPGITRFATRLRQVMALDERQTLDIDLPMADVHLTGQLLDITPQGLVGYDFGKVRPRHYLDLWVRHLIFNCLAPSGIPLLSRWLGEDKELLLRPVSEPQQGLQALLAWYWQGLRRPLPLFPDSAFAYVEACQKNQPQPLQAARRTWEGSEFYHAEADEPYHQMAWREHDPLDATFTAVADTVFLPLFAHVEVG